MINFDVKKRKVVNNFEMSPIPSRGNAKWRGWGWSFDSQKFISAIQNHKK